MKGTLHKMRTEACSPVRYQFTFGDNNLFVNDLLGHHVHLSHTGIIYCIQCGRETKKSFQQGFCFPCYRRLGECNLCMIHPERCRHDENHCRPDDWVHAGCLVPHVVYLANASGLKVGITRETQVPTRWMDQGALQALPIFRTQNRFQAGVLEVAFKQWVADKTNWRLMLSQGDARIDLTTERQRLLELAASAIEKVQGQFPQGDITLLTDEVVQDFFYPVIEYPEKIRTFNLDKNPSVSGHLLGIKGQYLMFDQGVLNVRKFGGYQVTVGEGCCG